VGCGHAQREGFDIGQVIEGELPWHHLYSDMPWLSLSLRLAFRAITDPTLGVALLRTAWRFRSRGWYARFPFLPLPDQTYVQWRMHTAYGDHDAVPPLEDIVRYARWAARAP
jgi:hypothetical protein